MHKGLLPAMAAIASCGLLLSAADAALMLPLKTDRVIAFETHEGTQMSPDLSPDGTTIVFDLVGDLYLLPIAGGRAARLTSGAAWDTQPAFSPDGRRLA